MRNELDVVRVKGDSERISKALRVLSFLVFWLGMVVAFILLCIFIYHIFNGYYIGYTRSWDTVVGIDFYSLITSIINIVIVVILSFLNRFILEWMACSLQQLSYKIDK